MISTRYTDNTKYLTTSTTPSQDEIILAAGYRPETHVVITPDHYILHLHRIVTQPGAPVVFMQHGLEDSSATWVLAGEAGVMMMMMTMMMMMMMIRMMMMMRMMMM